MSDHATRFEAHRCALREERDVDLQYVRDVHERAHQGSRQAALVDELRAAGGVTLSFVAEIHGGPLGGHALFSPVELEHNPNATVAVALGPMSVDPPLQGRGLGSLMYGAARFRLVEMGVGAVFVQGPQSYFGRFGFRPAADYGCRHATFPDAEFLVMELRPGAMQGVSGTVRYRPEFTILY